MQHHGHQIQTASSMRLTADTSKFGLFAFMAAVLMTAATVSAEEDIVAIRLADMKAMAAAAKTISGMFKDSTTYKAGGTRVPPHAADLRDLPHPVQDGMTAATRGWNVCPIDASTRNTPEYSLRKDWPPTAVAPLSSRRSKTAG
ncbi:hypothetical protein ACU8OT_09730 [Rhizobium leguminosarum]